MPSSHDLDRGEQANADPPRGGHGELKFEDGHRLSRTTAPGVRRRPITVWSVLALITVALGGMMTYAVGEASLDVWVASGLKFPIGHRHMVELPAGPVTLYYESDASTPMDVHVSLLDPYGERIALRVPQVRSRTSFECQGRYFRTLYEADVPERGEYELGCYNLSVGSDAQVPAGDRVVLGKVPPRHDDAIDARRLMHIIGATLTVVPAIGMYVLHGVALHRRQFRAALAVDE
jgi:hypothetical protein